MYELCHTTLNIDREQFNKIKEKIIIIGSDLLSGIKKNKNPTFLIYFCKYSSTKVIGGEKV